MGASRMSPLSTEEPALRWGEDRCSWPPVRPRCEPAGHRGYGPALVENRASHLTHISSTRRCASAASKGKRQGAIASASACRPACCSNSSCGAWAVPIGARAARQAIWRRATRSATRRGSGRRPLPSSGPRAQRSQGRKPSPRARRKRRTRPPPRGALPLVCGPVCERGDPFAILGLSRAAAANSSRSRASACIKGMGSFASLPPSNLVLYWSAWCSHATRHSKVWGRSATDRQRVMVAVWGGGVGGPVVRCSANQWTTCTAEPLFLWRRRRGTFLVLPEGGRLPLFQFDIVGGRASYIALQHRSGPRKGCVSRIRSRRSR